jgi:hypothetical protein
VYVTVSLLSWCRIYGLEAHISMLVLTPHNMHILCGFVAVRTQKGGKHDAYSSAHCVLEWVSPLQQQQEFDKLNTTHSRPVSGVSQATDWNDNDWVEEIWKELLRSDLGYSHFPLSEVYSFFRRRHQLKYTALEVTDVKGYSVLYSCESVSVCALQLLKRAVSCAQLFFGCCFCYAGE